MSAPARRRELYIYWKTDAPLQAVAAVRAAQAQLCSDMSALDARTLLREAGNTQTATVMETYRHPHGIDAAMQARIEATVSDAARPLIVGERHCEVFVEH